MVEYNSDVSSECVHGKRNGLKCLFVVRREHVTLDVTGEAVVDEVIVQLHLCVRVCVNVFVCVYSS